MFNRQTAMIPQIPIPAEQPDFRSAPAPTRQAHVKKPEPDPTPLYQRIVDLHDAKLLSLYDELIQGVEVEEARQKTRRVSDLEIAFLDKKMALRRANDLAENLRNACGAAQGRLIHLAGQV